MPAGNRSEIDYICSYGPGHPILDAVEVKMIRRVFGAVASVFPSAR